MFERFTKDARASVTDALRIAQEVGARQIAPVHLLAAIAEAGGPGCAALTFVGVEPVHVRAAMRDDPLDSGALAALGIDVDAVRAHAEQEFGAGALDRAARRTRRGRLPMSRAAKAVLGRALGKAAGRSHRRLDTGHLVLGLVDIEDRVVRAVLAAAAVDAADLRADVERRIDAAAA